MYIRFEHPETVSASEIRTWKTCRQQWYWRYVRQIEAVTIAPRMSYGLLGHRALQALFQGEDMRDAMRRLVADQPEIRFEETETEGQDPVEFVARIVTRWLRHDTSGIAGAAFIAPEETWITPVQNSAGRYLGYLWSGRFDAVIHNEAEESYILEAKFPGHSLQDPQDIELSSQVALYLLAARAYGKNPRGLVHLQILRQLPAQPHLNKNGSMSRQEISSDWTTYREALLDAGLDPEANVDVRTGWDFSWRDALCCRVIERWLTPREKYRAVVECDNVEFGVFVAVS